MDGQFTLYEDDGMSLEYFGKARESAGDDRRGTIAKASSRLSRARHAVRPTLVAERVFKAEVSPRRCDQAGDLFRKAGPVEVRTHTSIMMSHLGADPCWAQ